MKKESTRFWIAIIIVSAILITFDIIIGIIADKAMDKLPNYSGQLAKDNYRLHRLESEVVIIGSSRGSHHYVTQQLSDSINSYYGRNISIYNAAIDGKFAKSNSCAAEALIARYRPKLVIYDISESQLCNSHVADIEFSAPFYWSDTIVKRYLDDIGTKERIMMKSSLYRYNGKILRIVSSFLKPIQIDDGYLPLYGTTLDTTKITKTTESPKYVNDFDDYTINNFQAVLRRYSSADVPLIVVCSPQYCPNNNNKRLASLCNRYGIPFIDMYDTPYFNNNPKLFKDASHLNDKGAHIYTELFFEEIKPYLSELPIE